MARKRRPNEKSSYRPAPTVPADLSDRYQVLTLVLAGQMTVSEGARRLGMARVNFQTLLNRTKQSMIEALGPRPSGPTPTPAEEAALSREVEALRRDNQRLNQQLHTMDRLLGAAGDVIRGLRQPSRPRTSTSSSRRSKTSSPDEDDEGPPSPPRPMSTPAMAAATAMVMTMREPGATSGRRARALGIAGSTMRRWLVQGVPWPRRRTRPAPPPEAEAAVRTLVRELRGLAGAASLAQSVAGVSRRQAGALKRAELAAMERERKAGCARVEVTAAGVVRGFDAVHVGTTDGMRYVLAAGDAHVAYRTSLTTVEHYDAHRVAAALDNDFAEHGPPLVCRMDRASCHRTPEVAGVLGRWRVLPLHGPPHHPQYYGQLERQNREHRAWLDAHDRYWPDELAADCHHMRTVLNRRWRRPTLDWRTAECVWEEREELDVDRDELHEAVTDGAARRVRAGLDPDFAWRLALEHTLVAKGLLTFTPKPTVLCAQ